MTKEKSADVLYIDLEKTVRESDSKILQKLPTFAIKLMKRIVKQNEMNSILNKYSDQLGLDFLNAIVREFNLNLRVHGLDNLPEDGRCFFASNHPFGILDGLVLSHTVASKYGHVKAIANDAFLLLPHLRPFIAEVNVYGSSSKEVVRTLNETYNSEYPITHFPAGEVSRLYHGKIQDAAWQKSFIRKAISSKRNIVPIFFAGQNSRLFYSIYRVRTMLGISANLELMLLPREMLRCRNKTVDVYIGKLIDYKDLTPNISAASWAQKIRDQAYALAKQY